MSWPPSASATLAAFLLFLEDHAAEYGMGSSRPDARSAPDMPSRGEPGSREAPTAPAADWTPPPQQLRAPGVPCGPREPPASQPGAKRHSHQPATELHICRVRYGKLTLCRDSCGVFLLVFEIGKMGDGAR